MLKEEFKNAIYDREKDTFDRLYFISTRRKHESGYHIIEVYGSDDNEGKFYALTRCSDVLDLSGIHFETKKYWNLVSIDVPEPGVFRMFIHQNGFKFCTPLKGCSSFHIEVVKENNEKSDTL